MATPTPQLKPGASKFRTEEGATKVLDAFLHTLLAAVQVNDGKTNVIQVKQSAKSQVGKMMIEKMLPAKTFTICILQRLSPINTIQALEVSLPSYEVMMAENNQTPESRTKCASPLQKECLKLTNLVRQELHMGQLDSGGEEQLSSVVEENGEDDDPHIWLNASKVQFILSPRKKKIKKI